MATQLVKKNFGGKRKGYQGSKWDTAKRWGGGLKKFYGTKTGRLIDLATWVPALYNFGKWSWGGKEGGRVKGVGKATHGYGKAMRKK